MRLPYPSRVSYSHAAIFATALTTAQLLEGTTPAISGLCFCYIMVAALAFNVCGGVHYPSGAFVGINAIMTLLLPMTVKVILGESAQSNLRVPVRTIEAYLCGMIALCIASMVTRKLRARSGYISNMLPAEDLRAAYRGCIIFGFLLTLISTLASSGDGSIGSFLNQINRFPALAYLLGVVATVYFSGGRRSLTLPLLFFILSAASSGLITFSKEAFTIPFFCWAVACAYMRYSLTWLNIACFAVGIYVTVTYMVPYAQIGRGFSADGRSSFQVAGYLLTHIDEVRAEYLNQQEEHLNAIRDFNYPIPFLDRIDVLSVDDALVDSTERIGYFGYAPIIAAMENAIPHVLWPGKPRVFFGNAYGHDIGVLGAADNVTGVSFSFAGDAYHEGGIFCLLIICPVLFMVIFTVLDSVIGDTRRNPVGLVMIVIIFKTASEGLLTGPIDLILQPLFAVFVIAFMTTYVLSVIGRLLGRSEPPPNTPSNILSNPQPVSSV